MGKGKVGKQRLDTRLSASFAYESLPALPERAASVAGGELDVASVLAHVERVNNVRVLHAVKTAERRALVDDRRSPDVLEITLIYVRNDARKYAHVESLNGVDEDLARASIGFNLGRRVRLVTYDVHIALTLASRFYPPMLELLYTPSLVVAHGFADEVIGALEAKRRSAWHRLMSAYRNTFYASHLNMVSVDGGRRVSSHDYAESVRALAMLDWLTFNYDARDSKLIETNFTRLLGQVRALDSGVASDATYGAIERLLVASEEPRRTTMPSVIDRPATGVEEWKQRVLKRAEQFMSQLDKRLSHDELVLDFNAMFDSLVGRRDV